MGTAGKAFWGTPMEPVIIFKKRITELCEKYINDRQDYTLKDLSVDIGINYATLHSYVNPKSEEKQPDFNLAIRLASFFGVSLDYLFGLNSNDQNDINNPIEISKYIGLTPDTTQILSESNELKEVLEILLKDEQRCKNNTRIEECSLLKMIDFYFKVSDHCRISGDQNDFEFTSFNTSLKFNPLHLSKTFVEQCIENKIINLDSQRSLSNTSTK